MTITLDEKVYEGLCRTIGKRRMSQFIEDLLRPHVLDGALDDAYRAMANDQAREIDAQAWCRKLLVDTNILMPSTRFTPVMEKRDDHKL